VSGKWKVQTIDDYKKNLKKKVWEIRTLRDFKDFLNDLANTSSGRIFYMPLALKFNELYDKVVQTFGLAVFLGFWVGVLCGYALKFL